MFLWTDIFFKESIILDADSDCKKNHRNITLSIIIFFCRYEINSTKYVYKDLLDKKSLSILITYINHVSNST